MKKLFALLLALFCLAGSIGMQPGPEQTPEFGLWFAVDENGERSGHTNVVEFEARPWEKLPAISDLLDALLAGPGSEGLTSPFPAGVRLLDIRFDPDTETLFLDLSEQYGSLSGYALTVADSCIVMTLSQVPGVKGVRILVEGETLPSRNRQTLQKGDLMLTGIAQQSDAFLTVLYFPGRDNQSLNVEYRLVERYSDNAAEIVVTELLRGPVGIDANPALPEGTQILGLSLGRSVCQIDLSSEFVDNAPQGDMGPTMTLYALINTLCALGGISQVRVMVEGAPLQNYHGVVVSSPASANFDLVSD